VIAALRAFEPPVVLIAGGRDKGVDLRELATVVAERAYAAVLIGESGAAMARQFSAAGLRRVERAASLEAAIDAATAIAREVLATGAAAGDATVLLSPAAASFDMFVDYAARGEAFKDHVRNLRRRAAASGGTTSERGER
jgi:UDP-N-acetylmuramoylalanine--D-glutamate ligase